MKKILFVMYSLNNGGAERSLVNLLSEIDPKRYEIDLFLFAPEGMFLPQVPQYVNVIKGNKILELLYSQNTKMSIRSSSTIIYKIMATAITRITENGLQAQNAARWIKFYSKVVPSMNKEYDVAVAYISRDIMYYVDKKVTARKKVVFIHNDYRAAGHPKKYDTPYFDKMDALITISDTCADVLKNEFPEMAEKVVNVPNIVSSSSIRKRANMGNPIEFTCDSRIKLVSIGRLNEQKGFNWAIETACILKRRGVEFLWLIIGNGELKKQLKKQIEESNVSDCIQLIGVRDNPYTYIKAADIVVQTSKWEGKSVVLDEAKIIGTPIITTNYPTAKDQIKDGDEGLIMDMTPEAIAGGIDRLISNHELREHIHEYLLEHEYGNSNEIEKYYRIFDGE